MYYLYNIVTKNRVQNDKEEGDQLVPLARVFLLITSYKSSIYSYTPRFLEYSVIYVLWSILTAKIEIILFCTNY